MAQKDGKKQSFSSLSDTCKGEEITIEKQTDKLIKLFIMLLSRGNKYTQAFRLYGCGPASDLHTTSLEL